MIAAERRKKLILRGTAAAIVVILVGTAATSMMAFRSRSSGGAATETVSTNTRVTPATPSDSNAEASQPNAPVATPVANVAAPISPIIPRGQSELSPGVVAVWNDSAVVLSFDSPMIRTRRPEKFEYFLRTTLPQVYGAPMASALSGVPDGSIAAQGDLLNDLPTRGVHIPVTMGWKVDVYPETRPGQDGPLVIRYRASITRS